MQKYFTISTFVMNRPLPSGPLFYPPKLRQDVQLYESINVEAEPRLKDALMHNQLNRVACADCDANFRVDLPLLYNDPGNNILIHWIPETGNVTRDQILEDFDLSMEEMGSMVPADISLPQTLCQGTSFSNQFRCNFPVSASVTLPSVVMPEGAYPVSSISSGTLPLDPGTLSTGRFQTSLPLLASIQMTSLSVLSPPDMKSLFPQTIGELKPFTGLGIFHRIFFPLFPSHDVGALVS